MIATMDAFAPSMPGSFHYVEQSDNTFNRITSYDSIFLPPQPSPRISSRQNSRTPSQRSSSGIPRPVSKQSQSQSVSYTYGSTKQNDSARKRPRLSINQSATSHSPIQSRSNTPRPSPGSYFGLDGVCDWYPSPELSSNPTTYDQKYLNDSAYSIESPAPLVNTKYVYAGGLDSSSASFERGLEERSRQEEEQDWRMNRYSSQSSEYHSGSNNDRRMSTTNNYGVYTPRTSSFNSVNSQSKKRSYQEDRPLSRSWSDTREDESNRAKPNSGWGIRSAAWALTGGLAVKAISFAWTTAFSGFRAGGGTSYKLDTKLSDYNACDTVIGGNDVFSRHYQGPAKSDDLPGGFPNVGFNDEKSLDQRIGTGREANSNTPTTSWGVKDNNNSALKSDWHVIDEDEYAAADESNRPVRKRSKASTAGASVRNNNISQTSNTITTSKPSLISNASFASPRARTPTTPKQIYHHHHRASSTSSLNSNNNNNNYTPRSSHKLHQQVQPVQISPTRHHSHLLQPQSKSKSKSQPQSPSRRTQSIHHIHQPSSPNKPTLIPPSPLQPTPTTPVLLSLSPEIKQYRRQVRKKEKIQDETMMRLNNQMKEMIRAGREALGTRFFIEEGEDGEDGEDGVEGCCGGSSSGDDDHMVDDIDVDEGFFDGR